MTARIGNYVGFVPAAASVAFPFVGNLTLHDRFPFVGNSTCSSDELLLVRNQICSSGEILSVGNLTRDSDQILQHHDLAGNDPSQSQSEIALVLHEIVKTRECVNAVFDHLDDLCDRMGAFCEKRERDHRVNKDVAIFKSTSPTCSFIDSMESDYRPLRVNGQHGWRRTLCFHYKAHGHFAYECPNLSAPSRADIDLNWIKRNLRDFVNDMENFSGTLVVPRDANLYNVGDEQNGIDLNSMIRRNPRDFDLNSMITWNLCDFLNDMENFNGPLVVARDANFDNMGGQQNDLFENKCDERFISCDSDVNSISSEPCDAGNISIISTRTYTEHVGVTKDFDDFRGCQTDVNIVYLIPTCTYEIHLYFGDDNSSELQLYEV